ncbi:hypothetical protein BC937DRAFT_90461 [Endogone sp. FLAS-F59071]|nr:hypothetical protein BC937DRAFT_90461 [Endogone sp. FLAS-F59071]|eukprot:RUS17074.1 hypothetical protein BC937DRAFT_90461 [Endogone sp. FLAS-F59071]
MSDKGHVSKEKLYTQPRGYGFTPALQRTRAPYRMRNAATLLGLLGFTVGVYSYAILAVKQDDFSDVPLPNAAPGVQDVTPKRAA